MYVKNTLRIAVLTIFTIASNSYAMEDKQIDLAEYQKLVREVRRRDSVFVGDTEPTEESVKKVLPYVQVYWGNDTQFWTGFETAHLYINSGTAVELSRIGAVVRIIENNQHLINTRSK